MSIMAQQTAGGNWHPGLSRPEPRPHFHENVTYTFCQSLSGHLRAREEKQAPHLRNELRRRNYLYPNDERGPCLELSPISAKNGICCLCSAYKTHSVQKIHTFKKRYRERRPPSGYLEIHTVNVILQN